MHTQRAQGILTCHLHAPEICFPRGNKKLDKNASSDQASLIQNNTAAGGVCCYLVICNFIAKHFPSCQKKSMRHVIQVGSRDGRRSAFAFFHSERSDRDDKKMFLILHIYTHNPRLEHVDYAQTHPNPPEELL